MALTALAQAQAKLQRQHAKLLERLREVNAKAGEPKEQEVKDDATTAR